MPSEVAKLTDAGAAKAVRLQTIEGTVPSPTNLPFGCHFAPRCEFRMDICIEGEIPLTELANGVKVRCVLHDARKSFEIGKERALSAIS